MYYVMYMVGGHSQQRAVGGSAPKMKPCMVYNCSRQKHETCSTTDACQMPRSKKISFFHTFDTVMMLAAHYNVLMYRFGEFCADDDEPIALPLVRVSSKAGYLGAAPTLQVTVAVNKKFTFSDENVLTWNNTSTGINLAVLR